MSVRNLLAWATDILAGHQAFQSTFLLACSKHEGIPLYKLGGVEHVRARIGAFAGIVVGVELTRVRAAQTAIEATDWQLHDMDWQLHDTDWQLHDSTA